MTKRTLAAGVMALAASLLLVSCSAGSPAPEDSSAAPGVKKGGIATIALATEPDSLDATTANTFSAREVFTTFCEKLYDADAKLNLVPQLAAELPKVSDDGLTVDIKLRTGIQFNDGTPFDAAAVKTTLDRDRTYPTSARKKELAAVQDVTVVDPSTVRLTLNQPFAPLGAQLADRAGVIMSPTQLQKMGDNFTNDPVCVGPFTFQKRVPGSEIDFVKSDYYYDKDKVNLDGVTYKFIVDPNVRAANLRSGDLNAAEQITASDVPQLKAAGVDVQGVSTIAYQALSINTDPTTSSNPLAKSPELRKAFELALDRDAINKVVFSGANTVDCLPLPMQSAFRPSKVTCSKLDPKAAEKILKDSGEKLPIPVDLMVPTGQPGEKTAEVIKQMADKVGFDVTIRPVEFVTSLTEGRAGKFEMFLIGWSGRIDPDGDLNDIVTTGGSNNFSRVSDPELDQLVKQAAASNDVKTRAAVYAKVLDKIDEIKPNIYLYHDKWFLGMSGIAGVGYSSDALPRFKTAYLTK